MGADSRLAEVGGSRVSSAVIYKYITVTVTATVEVNETSGFGTGFGFARKLCDAHPITIAPLDSQKFVHKMELKRARLCSPFEQQANNLIGKIYHNGSIDPSR